MALYELLIRGNADGTISGSHVVEYDGDRPGLARPVIEADWPAIAVDVNALLSSQVSALEAEKAEFEAEKAALTTEKDAEKEALRLEKDAEKAALVEEKDALAVERDAIKTERDHILSNLETAIAAAREDAEDPIAAILEIKSALREARKTEATRKREQLFADIQNREDELQRLRDQAKD